MGKKKHNHDYKLVGYGARIKMLQGVNMPGSLTYACNCGAVQIKPKKGVKK